MAVETSQPKLTPREQELAELLSQDWSIFDIAALMGISRGTVYDYIDTLTGKLGCRSTRGIVAWYITSKAKTE
jgi:DNA-binding CsgD family transcriptional regulator